MEQRRRSILETSVVRSRYDVAQRSDQTSDLSALVIDIGRPRRVPIASLRSHCYSPFTAFAYRKPRNMRHRRRRFHRGQDPEYQMFQLFVQGKRGGRGSARTAFNHARVTRILNAMPRHVRNRFAFIRTCRTQKFFRMSGDRWRERDVSETADETTTSMTTISVRTRSEWTEWIDGVLDSPSRTLLSSDAFIADNLYYFRESRPSRCETIRDPRVK